MSPQEILNQLQRLYANLPTWLHWLATWLTGQAPPGRRPRWPWTARWHTALYFSVLLFAGATSIWQMQTLVDHAARSGFVTYFN